MKQVEVESTIREILETEFEVEPEQLTQAADLYEDIELDSLDAVDLVVALEKTFSIKIDEEEMRQLRTFGELTQLVLGSL